MMNFNSSMTQMKEFSEKAYAANLKLLEAQSNFAESFFKRNASAAAEMADARLNGLNEMLSIKSFTEFYDASVSLEESLRDKATDLYEENTKAVKDYSEEMKSLLDVNEFVASTKEFTEKAKSMAEEAYAQASSFSEEILEQAKTAFEEPAPKKPAAKKAPAAKTTAA